MVLTDPDKHGTEWGWKIIYGIFLWSASWGSLMTMKVLGFQLHPKSSRHPGTLLVPNGNWAPALQTRARRAIVLYESLTANSNSACVLLYCLKHVVNTVPLLLRKPLLSCSSVKHIMFYCGFEGFTFPSNYIQHALDSLDISGTLLAWNRKQASSRLDLMNKNFGVF